ncbi:GTP cyclohydrolase FolE2 [Aliifodinibius sp. S!AR15-10]|uniref:GTP cyclohydrolase FolE2 n=1 Tax=Aliifodinibius sp. S!AR15-10 TaxID=2950437 RepID=UPI00285E8900|nr:GTP cyclohydrolase FolE2 [Aliifodinibius sp. S!AR15-10]MDR8390549.1 GTP cyclohydrolase FolE2 [Aliifodinibius sp. S!AR15-10]
MISTKLKRVYDPTFTISDDYKASLPDLQNGPASLIEGANVPIQQVGISNFKLPLKFPRPDGELITLETSVDGYVGLEADKKGINMSRIIRSFYKFKNEVFHLEKLREVLKTYKKDLDTHSGYLRLSFNYPIIQESLRSELEGYQYYNVALEGALDNRDNFRMFMHLDFEYSSACPCSYELSEHAKDSRDVAAIPHSQRSIASVTVELDEELFVEDLVAICREALQTETQVMVKREDEQAFAEMNAAYQKFVEDAARLVYEELDEQEQVVDFVVRCVHMESLHSHDAVSRICKGVPGGLR